MTRRIAPHGPTLARAAAVVAAATWALVAPAEPQTPQEIGLAERTESRVRTLRLRVEPRSASEVGACAELSAGELRVRLGGELVEAADLRLERGEERRVHALLLDTSGSVRGDLQPIKAAAAEYVRGLDTELERALVVAFATDVELGQPATADVAALERAVAALRLDSGMTRLHDALRQVAGELEGYAERPVVLLLTDGADTGSRNERADVLAALARRPDLTVFVVGFDVAPLVPHAPAGASSTKRFLQRLALRTHGRYFEAPTASRLGPIFRAIRDTLDREASLSVADPRPDESPRPIDVSSLRPGCRVTAYEIAEPPPRDAWRTPLSALDDGLPATVHAGADSPLWRGYDPERSWIDRGCPTATPPEQGGVGTPLRIDERGLGGCVLDVGLVDGLIYNPYTQWSMANPWLSAELRRRETPVAEPARLPRHPAALMPELARAALAADDGDVTRFVLFDGMHELHARPRGDHPRLIDGDAFHDLRPALALALFRRTDYRAWALDELGRRAERELGRLERRLHELAPRAPAEAVRRAARESAGGREILRRATAPTAIELQPLLAAWLGDVSAHELFVEWERGEIERRLAAGSRSADGDGEFEEAWRALHELVRTPSYNRTLALFAPLMAPEGDRVGYWRVLLPRVGWILPRLRGDARGEWHDLPFDLVPERPLAVWVLGRLAASRPELARRLAGGRVVTVSYEPTGKPYTRSPDRAFESTRIRIGVASSGETVELVAEVRLARRSREPSLVAFEAR